MCRGVLGKFRGVPGMFRGFLGIFKGGRGLFRKLISARLHSNIIWSYLEEHEAVLTRA